MKTIEKISRKTLAQLALILLLGLFTSLALVSENSEISKNIDYEEDATLAPVLEDWMFDLDYYDDFEEDEPVIEEWMLEDCFPEFKFDQEAEKEWALEKFWKCYNSKGS